MKKFIEPTVEIRTFSLEDVLTTSGDPTGILTGEDEGPGEEVEPWW